MRAPPIHADFAKELRGQDTSLSRLDRWQRNLIAVWPSMFAVSLGLMAVIPTLPLYIRERFAITDPQEVAEWTAWVFAAGPLTAAVVGPLWGALGDTIGRKVMVLRAVIAIAVVMMLIPSAPTPGWMVALRAMQGVLAGYVAPGMALVIADAPAERQSWAIARVQLALALGLALGPPLGAEVAAWLGRGAEFYAAGALSALSAVNLAVFAREDRSKLAQRADGESILRAMNTSLFGVLGNRVFLALLALVLIMRLGQNMLEPFMALWIEELGPLPWIVAQGQSAEHSLARTTALAFTIVAVAQLLFTTGWGRLADRFGPLRCLAVVCFGLAIVLAVTSTVDNTAGFLGLRCLAAVFMAGSMTLAYASAARRVSPLRKSVALSLVQSCAQLGFSIGPVGGAVLAGSLGLRGLFVIAAILLCLAGAGMLWLRFAGPPPRRAATIPRTEAPS